MRVCIVGGGVIGLCSAYYLTQAGAKVSVIDKDDLKSGCSYQNAGLIVPSHIIPLAAPGMISKGIRWMFNPTSPFYVRPRLNYDLLWWGWHFYRTANSGHVRRSIPVLRDFSGLSMELYQQMAASSAFQFTVNNSGLLMLFKSRKIELEEIDTAKLANEAGVRARILNRSEIQALEPTVELDVKGGVLYPGDAHLDPTMFLTGLKGNLKREGVKFYPHQEVVRMELKNGKVMRLFTATSTFSADEVLICGGSWSGSLAKMLDIYLPIQAGKGYSITVNNFDNIPRIPSILTEAKVAVTPLGRNLRFAGTMEISGINTTISRKRVEGICEAVPQYYPGLKVEAPSNERIWYGLRPCSPDGLPYIGRTKRISNLTFATGHAMMGLSLGPATGKIVSEILYDKKPSIDINPFRPERFGSG